MARRRQKQLVHSDLAEKRKGLLFLVAGTLGLFVACFIVFQPALNGGFIWDDHDNIEDNAMVHAPDGLRHFWLTTENVDYWPLTSTTWWVEWRLWGKNTIGYHVVNVLLHAAGATFFWLILRRLKIKGAWIAAAIFAVHPVNVESVAWITERKNTLSMFFCMIATWCYLGGDAEREDSSTWPWYAASLLAFALGLLAKTSIVTLPIVLVLLIVWRKSRLNLRDILRLAPFFACSAAMALVTLWFQYHRSIVETPIRNDSFPSRLAVAGKAIWFYLYKLLIPMNYCFNYPRWNIGAAHGVDFLPLLLLAMFFLALAVLWKQGKTAARTTFIALAAYVLLLLPVLGFFNIFFMRYSLVSDHWQYIPSAVMIALIVGGIGRLLQTRNLPRAIPMTGAGAVLLILAIISRGLSASYVSDDALWNDTIAVNPSAWLAQTNLAISLQESGNDEQAIIHWRAADHAHPKAPTILIGLGAELAKVGQYSEAIDCIRRGIAADPKKDDGYFTLGNVHLMMGQNEDAIADFRNAVSRAPDFPNNHANLGIALVRIGKMTDAIAEYESALRIDPLLPEPRFNLGLAWARLGNLERAADAFVAESHVAPADPRPHHELGMICLRMHRPADALTEFKTELSLDAQSAGAMDGIARSYQALGDPRSAAEWHRRAAALTAQ